MQGDQVLAKANWRWLFLNRGWFHITWLHSTLGQSQLTTGRPSESHVPFFPQTHTLSGETRKQKDWMACVRSNENLLLKTKQNKQTENSPSMSILYPICIFLSIQSRHSRLHIYLLVCWLLYTDTRAPVPWERWSWFCLLLHYLEYWLLYIHILNKYLLNTQMNECRIAEGQDIHLLVTSP